MVDIAREVQQPQPSNIPVYNAIDLTKGNDLAQIILSDKLYTLRVTRAGKLILTK